MSAEAFYEELGVELVAGSGDERAYRCWSTEAHSNRDRRPSGSVNLTSGVWCCQKCGGGSAYEAAIARGYSKRDAAELAKRHGVFAAGNGSASNGTGSSHELVKTYDYTDATGKLLFQACRYEPKDFRVRRPDGRGGWFWNLGDVERPLYRLPEVLEAVKTGTKIFVAEGEKDADAIVQAGGVATTNFGGAQKWRPAYTEQLRGAKHVIVLADRDTPGEDHAFEVAQALGPKVNKVDVVQARHGHDAHDHLAAGGKLEDFVALERKAKPKDPDGLVSIDIDALLEANPGKTKDDLLKENPALKDLLGGKVNAASDILKLVHERADVVLFHTPGGRAFATFDVDDHRETHAVRSKSFEYMCRRLYHLEREAAASSQAIKDACATLEAEAMFAGETMDVHLRVAGDSDAIYIDLGDADWSAVQVTRDGWEIISDPPVRFRRAGGMLPLPTPEHGASIDLLRHFVNVGSDTDFVLLVAAMVAALRPTGPYPVLILRGEQGCAKSTLAKVIGKTIDPNEAEILSTPKSEHDLVISANNAWTLAYDNISRLQPNLSDALCRLSTGGGFKTRELYSDDSEQIFNSTRPIVLNGISEVATRSDLLDRAVLLELPVLKTVRDEKTFWKEYHDVAGGILGALLDAVVQALRNIDNVTLDRAPRMADFAKWATATEPTLWPTGEFMSAYKTNRAEADDIAIASSPIGLAVLEIADTGFHGTTQELLQKLTETADDQATHATTWPKTVQKLTPALTRIQPNLRKRGISVEHGREGKARARMVTIRRLADN